MSEELPVVTILNVSDISQPTTLYRGGGYLPYDIEYLVVDGVKISAASSYQFRTTGLHEVGYKAKYTGGLNQPGGFPFARTFGSTTSPIKEIRVSDSIIKIEGYSFMSMMPSVSDGWTIILPDSIQEIGDLAFRYCSTLHLNELPASLTRIGDAAFGACFFDYLHIKAPTPPTIGIEQFSGSYKLYVGDGLSAESDDAVLDLYLAAPGWSPYSSRLDTWHNYINR